MIRWKLKKACLEGEEKMANSSHYKVIVIDTESTGVDPYSDEILQVSIIDGAGKVLFNKYIKHKIR